MKIAKLIKEITLNGSVSDCYLAGDKIFLMGKDGECACGYSRLKDRSGYLTRLTEDGKNITITDDNICILGTPSMVMYSAVTVIDAKTGNIDIFKAFYGDITDVYCVEAL